MSAKWIAAKAWDDANLTGPLLPVKWLLRAFSSVTLAVILLTFIALYGALASVPIGLFALIPTQLFYGASILAVILLFTGVPLLVLSKALAAPAASPSGRAGANFRFVLLFLASLALLAFSLFIWSSFLWPHLKWVPGGADPHGIRFFPDFIQRYQSVLLRQLPGWEMTEVEFYGWWPMKLALLLFVINMVTATIRRIELRPLNAGVLTVHVGIVMIAVGSIIYERAKVEGDMLLLKNQPGADFFYDRNIAALYAWSERRPSAGAYNLPLPGLPRYNAALASESAAPWARPLTRDETYADIFSPDGTSSGLAFAPDVRITAVVPYGVESREWQPDGDLANPALLASMVLPDEAGNSQTLWSSRLVAASPVDGVFRGGDFLVRYETMTAKRSSDLRTPFPTPGQHMLIVVLPELNFRQNYTVAVGDHIPLGPTGWSIEVQQYQSAENALALVTEGYAGARSSRLELTITRPDGSSFNRSALSLYPERTQDFTFNSAGGPPTRSDPDKAIDVTYIDATVTTFSILQRDAALDSAARLALIRRTPGGAVEVQDAELTPASASQPAATLDFPGGDVNGRPVTLRLADYWPAARQASLVTPVPWERQKKDQRGNYTNAWLQVSVSLAMPDGAAWSRSAWLPFNQYLEPPFGGRFESFNIPGYGAISLMFGRQRHLLPFDELALTAFEMIPYPGTETPRDYVSTLRVVPPGAPRTGESHVTRLNRPYIYRVPFSPDPDRSFITNTLARIFRFFIPEQYKFSQAGWDPQAQEFSILGVGNNPGIYLIAMGGILMGLGIPVAFYVKPALLRRRSRILQAQLAAQTAASSPVSSAPSASSDVSGRKPKSARQSTGAWR